MTSFRLKLIVLIVISQSTGTETNFFGHAVTTLFITFNLLFADYFTQLIELSSYCNKIGRTIIFGRRCQMEQFVLVCRSVKTVETSWIVYYIANYLSLHWN